MLNKANKWMDGVSFMMLGGHLVLFVWVNILTERVYNGSVGGIAWQWLTCVVWGIC